MINAIFAECFSKTDAIFYLKNYKTILYLPVELTQFFYTLLSN